MPGPLVFGGAPGAGDEGEVEVEVGCGVDRVGVLAGGGVVEDGLELVELVVGGGGLGALEVVVVVTGGVETWGQVSEMVLTPGGRLREETGEPAGSVK